MVVSSQNIDELAKHIPRSELIELVREHFPKFTSKNKAGYLRKLKEISPDKYQELAVYHSSVRETSLYLFVISGDGPKSSDEDKLLALFKPQKFTDQDGNVYDLQNTGVMPDKTIFFTLNIHSIVKKFKKEKADMTGHHDIDYRDEKTTIVFFHSAVNCFEFRTNNKTKAEIAAKFISGQILNNATLKLKHITDAEQKQLCGGKTEYRDVKIQFTRSYHGAIEINANGNDIDELLKFFSSKGIKLENENTAKIIKSKITSKDQIFGFYDTGKITIKKKVADPFDVLARVIFKNGKS